MKKKELKKRIRELESLLKTDTVTTKSDRVPVAIAVNSCRNCPYSSNSAQEHDDPFTSQPATTTWFCNAKADMGNYRMIIDDPSIVDPRCPLKAKYNAND